jgi:hypothetical protein
MLMNMNVHLITKNTVKMKYVKTCPWCKLNVSGAFESSHALYTSYLLWERVLTSASEREQCFVDVCLFVCLFVVFASVANVCFSLSLSFCSVSLRARVGFTSSIHALVQFRFSCLVDVCACTECECQHSSFSFLFALLVLLFYNTRFKKT